MRLSDTFFDNLTSLTQDSRYDLACGTCGEGRRRVHSQQWLYPVAMPDGRTQWMLKVLMNNTCSKRCRYCSFGAHMNQRPARLDPEELAFFFAQLVRQQKASALFLSSAISDTPVRVMDDVLRCAWLVRKQYHFRGYLHVKLIPGIETDQVLAALKLADRVSVNLEAVDEKHLQVVAPEKSFQADLLRLLLDVKRFFETTENLVCRGATTQIVVGPAQETDREILEFMRNCYTQWHLRRVYYSAHVPLPGTPLESSPPVPLWRENRLYQADWLVRFYGFSFDEIPTDSAGFLHKNADPKTVWAHLHPEFFPLEINRAPAQCLMRVPGIGPQAARRIVEARRIQKFRDVRDLTPFRVSVRRAAPWLLFDGKRPMRHLTQLSFEFDNF